jgi:hydrogenase maturation protease
MRILVLGLGNDLYGDDGVGIEAVRRLRDAASADPKSFASAGEVSFVESFLSGAALLDVIVGHDALVIIDTIVRENPVPGRIHVLDGAEIRDIPGPSPHYISVPQTIDLGSRLGLDMPRLVKVVGVEAKGIYHLGEGLSEEMRRALPEILEKAREVILGLRDCSSKGLPG